MMYYDPKSPPSSQNPFKGLPIGTEIGLQWIFWENPRMVVDVIFHPDMPRGVEHAYVDQYARCVHEWHTYGRPHPALQWALHEQDKRLPPMHELLGRHGGTILLQKVFLGEDLTLNFLAGRQIELPQLPANFTTALFAEIHPRLYCDVRGQSLVFPDGWAIV